MSLLEKALEKYTQVKAPVTTDAECPVQSVDALSRQLRRSRDELLRAAGDDWPELLTDPAKLIAFADLLAISQIRESGGIPDTYTGKTTCQNCGEVPIWQGCPPQVNGCPWCLNRLAGLPMPNSFEHV